MKITVIAFMSLLISCSSPSKISDFSQNEIEYFIEIALGAEFGDSVPVIKKWTDDVRIKINGEPTSDDIQTIQNIVKDLNELIGPISVKIVERKENVTITFSPEADFSDLDPNYVPTNYGFFWALWHDDNFIIYNARILVASVGVTQKERSHLIREELSQSLGLMNDSDKYDNSIFYQKWTGIGEYSDLDKSVIRLLYNTAVKPGMSEAQILRELN